MDTEFLVKKAAMITQKALKKDGYYIELRIAPHDYGVEKYVIHAKSTNEDISCYTITSLVIDKLHSLDKLGKFGAPGLRRHISHVQVYDAWNQPSCQSSEIEKMFAEEYA